MGTCALVSSQRAPANSSSARSRRRKMRFGPSPQLISWFRDRYLDGSLTIKPPYQRRPVWAMKQKCYLIESILLGFPIPEIYVQSTTSAEGISSFAIVDGQQRIRA